MDLEVAGGLAADAAAVVDRDVRAHPLEHVEQAGAPRVQVDAVDVQLGAGDERGRDDERRGRGEVARHLDLAEREPLGRAHGDARRPDGDVCAGRLAACARCGRASGPARRPSSRRSGEAARRAGSPTSPARSRRAARSRSRASAPPATVIGSVAVRRLDACAHAAERLGDRAPSAARESDSSPVSSKRPVLPGEDAGEQPHERAGVAAVDRPPRRAQPAEARRRRRGACRRRARRRRRRARARRRSSPRCRRSGRSP